MYMDNSTSLHFRASILGFVCAAEGCQEGGGCGSPWYLDLESQVPLDARGDAWPGLSLFSTYPAIEKHQELSGTVYCTGNLDTSHTLDTWVGRYLTCLCRYLPRFDNQMIDSKLDSRTGVSGEQQIISVVDVTLWSTKR